MGGGSLLTGRGSNPSCDTGWTFYCCKNCHICFKGTKINDKEAGDGPFKKQATFATWHFTSVLCFWVSTQSCKRLKIRRKQKMNCSASSSDRQSNCQTIASYFYSWQREKKNLLRCSDCPIVRIYSNNQKLNSQQEAFVNGGPRA